MEEEENPKKRRLDLDLEKLFPSDEDDDEPPQIVIIKEDGKTEPSPPPLRPPSAEADRGAGFNQPSSSSPMEPFEEISDHELNEKIERQYQSFEAMAPKLPDKGAKLRENLKRLEEERERRKLRRVTLDVDESEEPAQTVMSSDTGNRSRQSKVSSKVLPESSFGSLFRKKIEEDKNSMAAKAFDKELSTLNCCGRNKVGCNGELSQKGRQNGRASSRQCQFQNPTSRSSNGEKHVLSIGDRLSNGDRKGRASSIQSLCGTKLNSSSHLAEKEDAFQVRSINHLKHRKEQTVVLVDEDDEPEPFYTKDPAEQLNELAECLKKKEAKIYYPSRDDPESVEISYEDMDCLAPEAYLSSPVMNFYIRYIQQVTPTNRAGCNYHVFSTYFYKKLKEAVAYKGGDKDVFFLKFRRWWKGVNIFQKAYLLIPIHEDLHWSLVIICIPDKEEGLGPIILHLDSLGFHCSKSIFNDIKRYMKLEWNYLNQEGGPLDLPIADKIWTNLPRRIEEKTIAVPQQKNDYDCGLFVLYFMERFIEEAPERLKRRDLAMFGKQWFKPEEASSLRVKIRNILMEEFQIACISEPSSSPESIEV